MSIPPYEILEHPADVGLEVYGRTLPELFANAARGLMSLALRTDDNSREKSHPDAAERLPVAAQGIDLEDLLVNWLSEILYLIDAGRWIFTDFSIGHVTANSVEGQAIGSRNDLTPRVVPVKAVTYHQISVRETGAAGKRWSISISNCCRFNGGTDRPRLSSRAKRSGIEGSAFPCVAEVATARFVCRGLVSGLMLQTHGIKDMPWPRHHFKLK